METNCPRLIGHAQVKNDAYKKQFIKKHLILDICFIEDYEFNLKVSTSTLTVDTVVLTSVVTSIGALISAGTACNLCVIR